jgi:outer membrane protein assembly factor BamB
MDKETGEFLWHEGSTSGLVGPIYDIVPGVVVMGRGNSLSGFRSSTGEVLWTREAVPNAALAATGPDQLFASDGDSLASYNPQTGMTRWTRPLPSQGRVTISGDEDVVCVGQTIVGGALVGCWRVSDGLFLWSRPFGAAAWVVVAEGRVLLPAGEDGGSGWTGLDAATGAILWMNSLPRTGPPAVSGDTGVVYACTEGGSSECIAVRVADGATVWRRGFQAQMNPPAVGEGNVYLVRFSEPDQPSLLVLDSGSGDLRERIDPDPLDEFGFCGTPATNADWVFLFGCYGYVYAFRVAP